MTVNVLEYLEKSAQRFPDKVVFGDINEELTYRELLTMAKKAGTYLSSFHLRNQPVAVITNHSVGCLAAFLGVVYSGNFYVPLDEKQPPARLEAMLSVAKPKVTIVLDKTDVPSWLKGQTVVSREDLQSVGIDEGMLAGIRRDHLDIDPLYLMFTSGSTGVPKGVLVGHRSVIDLAEQFKGVFDFDEKEVFANQAPFDFDVSVKDIYSTLKNGASMYILPQNMFTMPKKLVAYLQEKEITTCIWAVSALSILAAMKIWDKGVPWHLQKILFSGEVMPVKALNYWRKHQPQAMYVNLYGPTEITCNCTYYILDREFAIGETIPIGQAFGNTQVLLLDGSGKEAPKGELGEICVKGSCLALGYYNNREATEEVFCQNPGNRTYPDRIYHTGDYGRYNAKGLLEFAARKDWQIKHMGHRIELAEIENAGNGIDWIDVCCCQYDETQGKIVMAYQANEACDSQVVLELQKMLPKYMCPNRLAWLPQMPRNQRGKIDRVFLKRRYAGGSAKGEEDYLYREAVVLGTGSLALSCAEALKGYHIPCRIYDTGEQESRTLKRQAEYKDINCQWLPRKELAKRLATIAAPTLVVSAINPWIIPEEVLSNPYLALINCHQALLPRHLGRNAEMWAIYEEDEKTGITWHIVRPQVDRGEILIQKELPITSDVTAFGVFRQQMKLAYEAFCEILKPLLLGAAKATPQPEGEGAMHYSWETPEDGRLDLGWPFHKISAFLRALDYGGLEVVKKPYLMQNGSAVFWKGYQITKEPQMEEEARFVGDDIEILRKEGRVLLKNTYVGGK